MPRKSSILKPDLRAMLAQGESLALQEFCVNAHPAEVAEALESLPRKEAWSVLQYATVADRAEIFSHFDEDFQIAVISVMNRDEIAALLTEMAADDRADLVRELPESLLENVLPAMAKAEREDIRTMIAYQEGTAGAVMTSDYAVLSPGLTVMQALDRLREVAPDKETIYTSYVVDDQRCLLGSVTLKELILARREALIQDIMHQDIIMSRVNDDQEDAAHKIQKYDLIALPVVNDEKMLVGIITHDDAIDVIIQEQTEDMEKLMAISGSHEEGTYMKSSAWLHFQNRAPWVLALAILGLVSGYVVQSFEGLLQQIALLAVFMPMLADSGGNTGSQSATLVIRALALKEISSRDALRILGKEFQVGLLLAVLLGFVAYARVALFSAGSSIPADLNASLLGFAIALALGLQVLSSTIIGAMLPLSVARFRWDPAVIASPALTTIVDVTGLLIYFYTVKLVLGLG